MLRSPKSIVLLVLVLLAAGIMVRLGVWQLSRLHQKQAINVTRLQIRASAPVVLPQTPPAEAIFEHPAIAYGRFVSAPAFAIINLSWRGAPGVDIVNTFELRDGTLLLVDRGFVPLASRYVAPAPPTGPVELRGYLFTSIYDERPSHPAQLPAGDWVRLDPPAMGAATGRTFLPFALAPTHNTGDGRFPVVKKLPEVDEGPHLSYAIQWFSFATIFLVGGIFLLISKERKA